MSKIINIYNLSILFILGCLLTGFSNPYNNFFYFVFSILNFSLLFICFKKNTSFFEIFLSIFIFLGFWLKFSVTFIISSLQLFLPYFSFDKPGSPFMLRFLPELPVDFIISKDVVNETLLISSFAIFIIIFSILLRKIFLKNLFKDNFNNFNNFNKSFLEIFYLKHRNYIIILLYSIIMIITYINLKYFFYQKGIEVETSLHPLIININKWLLQFGLASFVCMLSFYDLKNKKSLTIVFFLFLLQSFLINFSLLSRTMILEGLFFLIIFTYIAKQHQQKVSLKKFTGLLLILIISFVFNLKLVNSHRACLTKLDDKQRIIQRLNIFVCSESNSKIGNSLNISENSVTIDTYSYKTHIFKIINYALIRWTGFDALVGVVNKKELNYLIYQKSFFEKFDKEKFSFYQRHFLSENLRPASDKNIIGDSNKVILPGFIAYSYYSGSLMVMTSIILLVIILGNLIEFLALRFSYYNVIFAAYFAYVFSFRLINFGYLPFNTVLFILIILLNILIIYLTEKLFKRIFLWW